MSEDNITRLRTKAVSVAQLARSVLDNAEDQELLICITVDKKGFGGWRDRQGRWRAGGGLYR